MIQQLINNPFFRIIGIGLILYYGLFSNTNHPDSLGNRLAPEKVKENFQEMSTKGLDIMVNVKKAEELNKNIPIQNQNPQTQNQILENKPEENKPEENKPEENNSVGNQNLNNGNVQ